MYAIRSYYAETNWPITGTAPYAPTSETECVSEEEYADFMVRYHLLAFASQHASSVYWHQLIAPGYGLIDNRDGIRNRITSYNVCYTKLLRIANHVLELRRIVIRRGI